MGGGGFTVVLASGEDQVGDGSNPDLEGDSIMYCQNSHVWGQLFIGFKNLEERGALLCSLVQSMSYSSGAVPVRILAPSRLVGRCIAMNGFDFTHPTDCCSLFVESSPQKAHSLWQMVLLVSPT